MLNLDYIRTSLIKKARDHKISKRDILYTFLFVCGFITTHNFVVIQAQNPKVSGSHSIPGQISDSSSLNTDTYSPSDFYLKNEKDLVSSSDEFGENQLTPSEHNSLREKKITAANRWKIFDNVCIELNADYTGHVIKSTLKSKTLMEEAIVTTGHQITLEESQRLAPELHKLLFALDEKIVDLDNKLTVKYDEVLESFKKKRGLVQRSRETLVSFTHEEIENLREQFKTARKTTLARVLLTHPIDHDVVIKTFETEIEDLTEVLHKANLRLTVGVKLPSDIKVESSAIATYEKSSGLELGGKLSIEKHGHSYSAMITHNLHSNKNSFSFSVGQDLAFLDFKKFLGDRFSLGVGQITEPNSSVKEVDGVSVRQDVKMNLYTWVRFNIFRVGTK